MSTSYIEAGHIMVCCVGIVSYNWVGSTPKDQELIPVTTTHNRCGMLVHSWWLLTSKLQTNPCRWMKESSYKMAGKFVLWSASARVCVCQNYTVFFFNSCGYVLFPKYMREVGYDPLDIRTFSDLNALHITLTVCWCCVTFSVLDDVFIV